MLAADGAGEVDLDDADELLAGPTAWLFGNEAWGLPAELAALADHRVRIPIHGRAESLNLSTAAALCLYASARAQRAREPACLSQRSRPGSVPARRSTPSPTAWWSPTRDGLVTLVNQAAAPVPRRRTPRTAVGRPLRRGAGPAGPRTGRDWCSSQPARTTGWPTRTGVPEQSWLLPDGTEVLVTARIHRPSLDRPGRPASRSASAPAAAGPGSTASAPTWSPPSPTSCARR